MRLFDLQERLEAALDAEVQKESEALADNRASDFADYRLRVGKIRGLKYAKDLLAQSVRSMLENDEDDTDGTSSGGLG